MDTNISCTCHHETTAILSLAGGLSILFILLIAVVNTTIICNFVRSKKKPQRESDVYYDTINNIVHSPPVIETELNIAYSQRKMLK